MSWGPLQGAPHPTRGQSLLAVVPGSPSLPYTSLLLSFLPAQDGISVMVSGASRIQIPNPTSGGSVSVNGLEPQAGVEGGNVAHCLASSG